MGLDSSVDGIHGGDVQPGYMNGALFFFPLFFLFRANVRCVSRVAYVPAAAEGNVELSVLALTVSLAKRFLAFELQSSKI